jgi:type I restriction enzyme M protein
MDASQYKDYVLVLLFIKYVSDKYAGQPYAPIVIPPGASLRTWSRSRASPTSAIRSTRRSSPRWPMPTKLSDMPDFNDPSKLGSGKEMVERLTNLIAIFENKALDFSKNRAEGDDILGDAYEYLMRHFAIDSGKSKGQFYTPAEVSRVIAQILGIRDAPTSAATTVYDPTCGSGSLLLKVADEAAHPGHALRAGEGRGDQRPRPHEHDPARQPHGAHRAGQHPDRPQVRDGGSSRPSTTSSPIRPFQRQALEHRLDPLNDPFERFSHFGAPPAKQGDYAYLLHIVRSLKSTGTGACILPHGVLFRGNAEAEIRRNLVRKGYIGHHRSARQPLLRHRHPGLHRRDRQARCPGTRGIFMIDASTGFMKDGPKNRLRAQDIHKIVDIFNRRIEVPRYSRLVALDEIEKNDFNLNLPRYIDSQSRRMLQDIAGHLQGGIPVADVDALAAYWAVCPGLRDTLFSPNRPGYLDLAPAIKADKTAIKTLIYAHPEFAAFIAGMNAHFVAWRDPSAAKLKALEPGCHPKEIIGWLSEGLLAHYRDQPLVDPYDIYQHLLDYWDETMQDDCYLIAADGWKAKTYRIIETDKKGKSRDKGWTCDLIPKALIVARYFAAEQAALDGLAAELEASPPGSPSWRKNTAARRAPSPSWTGSTRPVSPRVSRRSEAIPRPRTRPPCSTGGSR